MQESLNAQIISFLILSHPEAWKPQQPCWWMAAVHFASPKQVSAVVVLD